MTILKSIALGAATVIALANVATAETKLRLSDVLPEGNFQVENAKVFADAVAKATDGEVTITVNAAGSLGFKGPDQLGAVRDGLVDMADINISQQVGLNPLFGAEGVPFLVSSMDELKDYHAFLRPEFEKLAEQYNQKILYMVPSPAQYVYLKVEVEDIDGFKGIPVRGADKNTVDIVTAVGMAGVVMPWGELLPALASGRVDGVATSATSGVDGKFWEFLDYIYPTNHTWGSNAVTINLDTWNSISDEDRAAIEAVAADLEPTFWDVSRQGDLDSIKTMSENGMTLVPLSDELLGEIAEKAASVQEAFFERVPAALPIVDAYKASK
ncbi:TRAP transporter substrate-binding protein [Pacificibacter marinus]|uniref:Bacterial extracellular solute-binding protein, family 7 n=1 Tax=Pacificibacter marinus TaxID=658057 RepID=A0A1Y5TDK2_9RHOB|nr:TRAP transporter substrate-binding protein [Pacificibacter marinus]SEL08589.1 TRAP-type C4-dicarboxylate transport system, substrate-binding protein [Pacificibacter marinus]SLN57920.1 Bacterial extracellular solute-binding protein, family 7 [Pacificibacter marinus]